MNTKQINELRKLADAATPGPWEYDYDDQDHDTCIGILWGTNHYAIATIPYNGQVSDEKVTATGNYIAAANPAAILELIQQLEQERKRLDWALKNEAVYYCWGNVWRLCFNGTVPGSDEDIPTTNPRATIDELMEKAT